jgi:acetyl-CoA carboxylase biotin carboxylase subunit
MFKKILIANRGEIALRIIRACKELGIKTVAVYSTADKDSLHVKYADEAVCIGPPNPKDSYLNMPAIISAAEITDAEAIHPGYGFLAENCYFAQICNECKIKFIGPPIDAVKELGDKQRAKQIAKKIGIPVIPGSETAVKDEKEALKIAKAISYPVIIKAAGGGGGRGMRIVHTDVSLVNSFHTAKAEAEKAFGNPDVYIEKYIEEPRHVEIQIIADEHGNYTYLGERDCTIQRKYQKLIEEAPSPIIPDWLRHEMGHDAIKLAKYVGYTSVGTVEFLVDKNKKYYFMEVNTRIQVEHPVTEMVTGVDLIKQQILIAAGEKINLPSRKELKLRGHAIECRINAEDWENGFLPSPGKITKLHIPGGPGVRVDTHIYEGYTIPAYYDSLIAKVIVHGADRTEAIVRMERVLEEIVIEGVKTTIPFHKKVLSNPLFKRGEYSTNFIESIGI